ncbi:MAG: FKBP-type peptidyl-prolyl cis-trans isomerase [Alphaproteobacteria bacterium]|nr:FKBP-type peptidyl-prolyl cis-trans isomerase [Alphaproteobacteria bacterium]
MIRQSFLGAIFVLCLGIFSIFTLYSAEATLTITTTPSGLKYKDETVGIGPQPQAGQTVRVHYVGTLMNKTQFDSSRDRGQPFEFKLGRGQVIKGWDEGLATMKVGGRRTLTIPPQLAYGTSGAGDVIGPNETLIFDVELLGVED